MKPIPLFIVFVALVFSGCSRKNKQFSFIPAKESGITFNNTIIDNDTMNVLDVENIYNGGGVGIGDFNNDGLQDIYFAGNMVESKLYLNRGNFKFEDITEPAGVNGHDRWARGVSVIDINNDGLMDIYISASLHPDSLKRENLLYINKGSDAKGVPSFENQARQYNLAHTYHSTMAAFFDFDNDGDLDMYQLVNQIIKAEYPNKFRPILKNGEHPSTGKLYRNDANDSLKHPVFTDVSKLAGITIEGYGHGVNICDFNQDGWKDIYVSNDFLSNNILYINNGDGTFTDQVETYFKHTSENSMGQDVIDINNDGLVDVIEADMNPEDNFRKKMMLNPIGYQRYQNNAAYGYQHQYVRNVLQLNQGPRYYQNDSVGAPIFSDIGFSAGIAETDWSWAPVVTDFDNDGYRDIIITNGFPRDVTDHDFIVYRNKANMLASKRDLLDQIPEVKISNYAFRNNGDLTFTNMSNEWGLMQPSFSNGAAQADLDNDGDMDLVINNINDPAFLYRNNERELNPGNHYLQIQFEGGSLNRNGIGAWVGLYYDSGKFQVYENTPYRGYLSSIHNIAHFGLGKTAVLDSVLIKWPDGKAEVLRKVNANQVIKVDIKNASLISTLHEANAVAALFTDVTDKVGIKFVHQDSDFVDFNIQKLLPHKFSEYGPALAVADLDGNGWDDMICGGSMYFPTQLFLQQPDGRFIQRALRGSGTTAMTKNSEDAGILTFDADNDADPDIYITSGGYEAEGNTTAYADRLYVNDGKGNFKPDTASLPKNLISKSCVRAADFDKDGDLDLFLAGRVEPTMYPKPVSSFLLRNDTKDGKVQFTDISAEAAPFLKNIGLVCDALFTDFDNDGWPDLVLAGEWMPVTFLKNIQGRFENITLTTGISNHTGWWNSLLPGDLDNDGDIDYVVGNLGLNSYYRGDSIHPIAITANDFDANGSYDAFPSLYLPGSFQEPGRKEFPAHLRDETIKQMISMRARFQNYKLYAGASMDEILTEEQRKKALRLEANNMKSAVLINEKGKFTLKALPMQAQLSVINGMVADDFDADGNLDIIMNCNDFGSEVSVGRYDAMNGLLLKGNGKGGFEPISILHSGIFIPGNGKALVKLQHAPGGYLVAASQNKGPIKIFKLKNDFVCVRMNATDVKCSITYKNGNRTTTEINYGSSFYSQSGRFIPVSASAVSSIEVINAKGEMRTIKF